ncbi:hypothetical protein PSACC_00474 [Paramicrosporidium saccamoebae]|uniref:Uncharacterized protein n=1 Tax=Paramicrosporidium saccamoebae TaxID=1246581 RepID=A0A2H9TPP4_9FUNG|nr:hypothetical protein PSACC_00474 [Paramicrosporidium saccamoebae]
MPKMLPFRMIARALVGALVFGSVIYLLAAVVSQGEFSELETFSAITPNLTEIPNIEDHALKSYASSRLSEMLATSDFVEFARRLRFFGEIFDSYEMTYPEHVAKYSAALAERNGAIEKLALLGKEPIPEELQRAATREIFPYPASSVLWDLEREIFPWAHHRFSSLLEMKASFSGRGIVIPTGSHHLRFAIHLIKHIRLLKCSLPIIVAYSGDGDLKKEEIDYLRHMGVGTMDVAEIFNTASLSLHGWEIKPFALLAAPFEEVILADADIVFLQNPAVMLDDLDYQKHGAIIFHDRTLFAGDQGKTDWLNRNLPHPLSRRVLESRMYLKKSAHEQESGVVVWNKKTRLLGLLAACKMNVKAERDEVTYKVFYGDKESFWLGLEMAAQSYTHLQPVPGVIGDSRYDRKKDQLVACGRILQFDRQAWPLWFNGAIVLDKRSRAGSLKIMNFTHFAREGSWDFGTSCLDVDVTPINGTLKAMIDEIAALWIPNLDYTKI